MPLWLHILIAVSAALITTVGVLLRWSWWGGARVQRVDTEMLNFDKRITRIEKALDLEDHKAHE